MNPSTFQYLRARGCRPRARCRAARARTIGQERRGRWPLDNASLLFLVWCAAAGYSVTAGTITGAVQIVTRNKTVLARPTIMADEDRAVFSPDARHVAYPVGSRVQRVCLDGVEGKGYDVVTNLTFSPDGKRLAYWAITRTHVLVVVDGKEVKAPALIGTSDQLLFSPDCRHLAFGGPLGGTRGVVVLDDQVGPVYAELGELRFSPDSRRFAHMATRDDQTNVIVLDGKEIPVPDAVVEHTFTFSPDGRRFAYGLGLPPQSRMVVDGQAGPVFRGLGDCYFSPDSRRLALLAAEKKLQQLRKSRPTLKIVPDPETPDA